MSQAFECDRCHEYYTPKGMAPDSIYSEIDCVTFYKPEHTVFNQYYDRRLNIDLCPDCTQALLLFFANRSVDGEGGYFASSWVDREPEVVTTDDFPGAFHDDPRNNDTADSEKESRV